VAVIIKALGDSGKPLIFTSGSAIFGVFTKGEASPTIFDEDHPVPLPASAFAPPEVEIPAPFIDAFGGAMVRRVETETAMLKAAGVRGIAIRPGLVYGEGKGYDLPNLIALARTHGAAPHLGAGGVRQGYVHIDDLAELYVQALERAPAGTMLTRRNRRDRPWRSGRGGQPTCGCRRPNRALVVDGDVRPRRRRREPVGQQASRQREDPKDPGLDPNPIRHLGRRGA
jgi:nucleoside-diphosphate-sugar epimerase